MQTFCEGGEGIKSLVGAYIASMMMWQSFMLMPFHFLLNPIQNTELRSLRTNGNVLLERVNRIEKAVFDRGLM
jgi:hypothetical protein